jgi:hypothetical protein
MKKASFKIVLKNKILKYGYWSNEVLEFNTKMQEKLDYHIWLNWHNEAKMDLKEKGLI